MVSDNITGEDRGEVSPPAIGNTDVAIAAAQRSNMPNWLSRRLGC
jgi:hypothetical protein